MSVELRRYKINGQFVMLPAMTPSELKEHKRLQKNAYERERRAKNSKRKQGLELYKINGVWTWSKRMTQEEFEQHRKQYNKTWRKKNPDKIRDSLERYNRNLRRDFENNCKQNKS